VAVFVELVTDAFDDVFASQVAARQGTEGGGTRTRAGKVFARRPVRGIEVKEDTYAYLKVVLSNGQEWPLLDSSSPDGYSKKGYTNFILQQVTEQRMEKHQILETFGANYVFFFGESPRFLNCTAIMVSTNDFNWRAEWWYNYENYLRGTKLVELGARCYMFWDDVFVEGYILNCQASETSEQPYTVSMQFKFYVTKYDNVSLVNVEQYPIRSSVQIPEGIELTDADAFDRLQGVYSGEPRGSRLGDAVPRESQVVSSAADRNEANKITQKLRQMPNSMVVDPTVWNKLVGRVGIANPDTGQIDTRNAPRGGQLREKIAANVDEYISGGEQSLTYNAALATPEDQVQRGLLPDSLAAADQQEVESLEDDTINTLEAIGAEANNKDTLRNLGLGPNFSPGYRANQSSFAGPGTGLGPSSGFRGSAGAGVGASTSFGGSASATASFGVLANSSLNAGVSAGSSAGFGVSASARAGYYANVEAESTAYIAINENYQVRDPLNNVYGKTSAELTTFRANRRQFVEGAGDYEYGYRSAYGGIGYGKAGYGDFGGTGFGAANADGDPGFLDPEDFSFRGVAEAEASFSAWVRPKRDETAVTSGSILGANKLTGGASVEVRGRQTAFSLIALDGEIEDWVVEESTATRRISGTNLKTRTQARVERGPGSFSAEASLSIGG
jgi:hypothetical protein